jgi:predicted dithiol-disulfide oxidoreductase (DUF899 family)
MADEERAEGRPPTPTKTHGGTPTSNSSSADPQATSSTHAEWYSSSESSFGADVDAPPGAGFGVNVFLRDGDTVYRTWHTNGRGVEQLAHSFALIDILPWGRQEEWLDSPEGWPSRPTYSGWLDSPDIAKLYGRL